MKKLLVSVLVSVLLLTGMLTILAACEEPIDYEHTIIFYSSQGDKLKTQTEFAIDQFEAKYPGWKVIHQTPGGYDQVRDKVLQDLRVGNQPDLAYCYPDHVALYLPSETVVNMTPYLTSTETVAGKNVVVDDAQGTHSGTDDVNYRIGFTDKELEDFIPAYYEEGYARNFAGYEKYGFKAQDMLTLPFVKSTELLFYNKDALDACGFQPAKTWDELWAQAPKLVEKFPGCTPLGYDSESNWFIIMCEQNGWDYTSIDDNHFLFNNENTRNWLQQLNTYYEVNHWITTKQDYGGAYTSALFTKGVADNAGGVVYCVGSSGGASNQASDKFHWGVAPVPGSKVGNSVNNAAISQGPSLVMLTGGNKVTNASEKEKMTFLFIKELLDPTFQANFSIASGYNTCRPSTYDIPAYAKHMEGDSITAIAAKVTSTMADRFFVSPAFDGSSDARTQVGTALLLAMQGVASPEIALRDAVKNCGGNPNR